MNKITLTAKIPSNYVPFLQELFKNIKAKDVVFQEDKEYITNKITLKAMKDSDKMIKNPNIKGFCNIDDALNFLDELDNSKN